MQAKLTDAEKALETAVEDKNLARSSLVELEYKVAFIKDEKENAQNQLLLAQEQVQTL